MARNKRARLQVNRSVPSRQQQQQQPADDSESDSVIVLGSSSDDEGPEGAPSGGGGAVDLCSPGSSAEGDSIDWDSSDDDANAHLRDGMTGGGGGEVEVVEEDAVEGYQWYASTTDPLDPTVLQAVRSVQPPLPPAALSRLPLQQHRHPDSGALRVTHNPTDLLHSLIPEGRATLPADPATHAAFSGPDPVLLGHFDVPLLFNEDDKEAKAAASASASSSSASAKGPSGSIGRKAELAAVLEALQGGSAASNDLPGTSLEVRWLQGWRISKEDCEPIVPRDRDGNAIGNNGNKKKNGKRPAKAPTTKDTDFLLDVSARVAHADISDNTLVLALLKRRGMLPSRSPIEHPGAPPLRISLADYFHPDAESAALQRALSTVAQMSQRRIARVKFELLRDGEPVDMKLSHSGFGDPLDDNEEQEEHDKKEKEEKVGEHEEKKVQEKVKEEEEEEEKEEKEKPRGRKRTKGKGKAAAEGSNSNNNDKGKKKEKKGSSGRGRLSVADAAEVGEERIRAAGAAAPQWGLRLHVHLCPKFAQRVTAHEGELVREAQRIGKYRKQVKVNGEAWGDGWDFGALLQDLVALGSGLWLGPDSDGVLNFCDESGSLLTEEERGVVEGSVSAAASADPGSSSSNSGSGRRSIGGGCGSREWLLRIPAKDVLPPSLFSIQSLLGAGGLSSDYPEAAAPLALRGFPKHFQLQGLEWMLRRERVGEAAGRSALRLFPTWQQFVTEQGLVFYVFVPTGRKVPPRLSLGFLPAPSSGTCGGFLCDEMGLGKTLESLMLVLSNPPPRAWPVSTSHIRARLLGLMLQQRQQEDGGGSGSAPAASGHSAAVHHGVMQTDEAHDPGHMDLDLEGPIPIKTTLVIVPNNLMEQWQEEIRVHLKDGALKCGEYDGSSSTWLHDLRPPPEAAPPKAAAGNKGQATEGGGAAKTATRSSQRRAAKRAEDALPIPQVQVPTCKAVKGSAEKDEAGQMQRIPLPDLDVVFLSYEQMRRELSGGGGTVRQSPLLRYGFWRIMLDEAQLVADSNSVAAVMASQLWRRHAWVVTGTPVSSRVKEIRGLCEFLDLEPFSDKESWQWMVNGRYETRSLGGLLAMRGLLRGVMLRRTQGEVKEQLQLPPCTRIDMPIQLGNIERICYDQLLSKYRQAVKALKNEREREAARRAAGHSRLPSALRPSHVSKIAPRVMAGLTALRQSCCHPHIVAAAATASEDPKSGKRQTMREIMRRLVTKAYTELDEAVASWLRHCIVAAAAEDASEGRDNGASLLPVLEEVRANVAFAFGHGLESQARARCRDGTIREASSSSSSSPSSLPHDEAAQKAPQTEAEQAKEQEARDSQQRRYKRLELDTLVLQAFCISRRWPGALLHTGTSSGAAGGSGGSAAAAAADAADVPGPSNEASAPADAQAGTSEASPASLRTSSRTSAAKRQRRNSSIGSKAPAAASPAAPAAAPAVAAAPPAEVQGRLRALMEGEVAIREEMGLPAVSFLEAVAAGEVRRSRRVGDRAAAVTEQVGALGGADGASDEYPSFDSSEEEDEEGVPRGRRNGNKRKKAEGSRQELSGEELLQRSEACVRNLMDVLRKKKPVEKAQKAAAAAKAEMERLWHALQHLLNEEDEQAKERQREAAAQGEKNQGKEAAAEALEGGDAADGGKGGGDGAEEEGEAAAEEGNDALCPVCLDIPEVQTMTTCGHKFCRDCIHEYVSMGVTSGSGAKCPICRTMLRAEDLFDTKTDEEKQEELRIQELQRVAAASNGDYGSKVSALLSELSAIEDADPGAKSLVFSTWGRLLKLVGHALEANGVVHVSMAGSAPDARRAALHRFATDPDCRVLLLIMSKTSGAAGLTLTHANHAFLMEPALSPGLEAQAAARICRLGQRKPTRVVRFIAEDSVEQRMLEMQDFMARAGHRKQQHEEDEAASSVDEDADNLFGQADVDRGTLMQFFDL